MKIKYYKNPTIKGKLFQVSRDKSNTFNKILNFYSRGAVLLSIDKKRGKAFFVFRSDEDIQDLVDRHFCGEEVAILKCKAAIKDFRVMIFDHQSFSFIKEKKSEK